MSPNKDITSEILNSFKIIQIFCNQIVLNGNTKGVFSAATLQGKKALPDGQNQVQNQNNGQKYQKYFKGHSRYTFEKCYYLNKDLRPKKQKISFRKAKGMMKGLQQDKALQDKYKNAYKEIEVFLSKQKKKDNKDNKDSKPQENKTSREQLKPVIGLACVGTASATQKGSFSAFNYPLASSFILDCNLPIYICNNINYFN